MIHHLALNNQLNKFLRSFAGEAFLPAIESCRLLRGQEAEARPVSAEPRRELRRRTHGLQKVLQRCQGEGKEVRCSHAT